MSDTGVIYVSWGTGHRNEGLISQSAASVKQFGYPTCLITDEATPFDEAQFDLVRRISFPNELNGLCKKCVMYEHSPFDTTLFLDDDTVVLRDISFGFEMSRRHGISLVHAPMAHLQTRDVRYADHLVNYNSGVIFFHKNSKIERLFERWTEVCIESQNQDDQLDFSKTIHELQVNPFVMPPTWNLRAQFGRNIAIHGPIYIWHSRFAVPGNIHEWNNQRRRGFAYPKLLENKGSVLVFQQ